jgi:hypothetical protein
LAAPIVFAVHPQVLRESHRLGCGDSRRTNKCSGGYPKREGKKVCTGRPAAPNIANVPRRLVVATRSGV